MLGIFADIIGNALNNATSSGFGTLSRGLTGEVFGKDALAQIDKQQEDELAARKKLSFAGADDNKGFINAIGTDLKNYLNFKFNHPFSQ